MISYFKLKRGLPQIPDWESGCWIQVLSPQPEEIDWLVDRFNVPRSLINDISDVDERPRTEIDDDWQLIILRIPLLTEDAQMPFTTVPLGMMVRGDVLITLCFFETRILGDFISHKKRKNIEIHHFFEFFLRLLISSSVWYLKYLKQISHQIRIAETALEQSIKNEELQNLLRIEKSLVFFVTSLKGNSILLVKTKMSPLGKEHLADEETRELIEDAETEIQQAIELANIYSDILSGMMDAFASVISNNLNVIMKRLTSISIILMIPTLVASIYGMNVPNGLENNYWGFIGIIMVSFLISCSGVLLFKRRNWF